MKHTFLSLAVVALLFQGCATILPGSDPIVVNAERVTTTAYATFDSFLQIEYTNQVQLKKYAPGVHVYAEYVRRNGLNWLTTARALTKAYKTNRSPQNKANLQSAVAVLETMMTESSRYMTQAQVQPAATPIPSPTP